MSASKFDEMIAAKVAQWDIEKRDLHPQWITHEICKEHAGALGDDEDAEFWRHFAYLGCRKLVGRFIAKHFGEPKDGGDRQPVFPGFSHVQRRYVVMRDGDEVAVLAEHLTDEEIDAKADALEKDAQSRREHADELRRFKFWRRGFPAANANAAE